MDKRLEAYNRLSLFRFARFAACLLDGGFSIYSDLAAVEEQESALTKDVDLFNKLQQDLKESPAYK